jgi:hypothetical protein
MFLLSSSLNSLSLLEIVENCRSQSEQPERQGCSIQLEGFSLYIYTYLFSFGYQYEKLSLGIPSGCKLGLKFRNEIWFFGDVVSGDMGFRKICTS